MVTVKHEKSGMTTTIMEVHLDEYKSKGWVVASPKERELTEYEQIAKQTILDNEDKAAKERGRNKTVPEDEAIAIISTELKKEKEKEFTDGLIKE